MKKEIYTHNEAAMLIEILEDRLIAADIYVPSPEDDERDPDDMVGLYGTTYGDLLEDVENVVIEFTIKTSEGKDLSVDGYADKIINLYDELLRNNRITGFLLNDSGIKDDLVKDLTQLKDESKNAGEIISQVFSGNY